MDKLVKKAPLIDPVTKQNLENYKTLYQHSINNPEVYWEGIAKSITWNRPWKAVNTSDFFTGKIKWFEEAKLKIVLYMLHLKLLVILGVYFTTFFTQDFTY